MLPCAPTPQVTTTRRRSIVPHSPQIVHTRPLANHKIWQNASKSAGDTPNVSQQGISFLWGDRAVTEIQTKCTQRWRWTHEYLRAQPQAPQSPSATTLTCAPPREKSKENSNDNPHALKSCAVTHAHIHSFAACMHTATHAQFLFIRSYTTQSSGCSSSPAVFQ